MILKLAPCWTWLDVSHIKTESGRAANGKVRVAKSPGESKSKDRKRRLKTLFLNGFSSHLKRHHHHGPKLDFCE